ncbi:MAG: DUF924 family protein [Pseudomonadales bacterium]
MNDKKLSWQMIREFWLGELDEQGFATKEKNRLWFMGGEEADRQISRFFGSLIEQALAGDLTEWEAELPSRLSLIILLDQFTRNVYRGSAQAFAGDARALALVKKTLEAGEHLQLSPAEQGFLYMPLEHSENTADQLQCVALFKTLLDQVPDDRKGQVQGSVDWAIQHYDIVNEFGRFPHRNLILQRESTAAELQYMSGGGNRFGQ